MKRLSVVVSAAAESTVDDKAAGELIRRLMWLRCVEVTRTHGDDDETMPAAPDSGTESRRLGYERDAASLEAALATLRPMRDEKTGLFGRPVEASEGDFSASSAKYAEALKTAGRVAELKSKSASLSAADNHSKSVMASMQPWLDCGLELSEHGTALTRLSLGVLPIASDVDAIRAEAEESSGSGEFVLDEVSAGETGRYVALLAHVGCDEKVQSALLGHGFNRLDFTSECERGQPNTASAIYSRAEEALEFSAIERGAINKELEELASAQSGKCREMKLAYDIAKTAAGNEAANKLVAKTVNTSILTAWVPLGAVERVSDELDKFEKSGKGERAVWYEFAEPDKDETPPVMLLNNRFAKPFESVVGLYSLPAYGTFDPTFIMSMFYFVIFGFMLADVVYGLLLAIGGFIAVKKLNMAPGMKRLVTLFAICGVSCAIAGVLFGSYLGDLPQAFMRGMFGIELPTPYLWFDMVNDPITFLIVSFVIGALHLFTGMGIQFYILCREGRVFDAIFDVGSWYVLFIGIGLAVLLPPYGVYVAIAGVAMLVLTQGRAEKNPVMKLLKGVMSLYNIVSYVSDLLSYSRIMALGLASAVIAQVVNLFATMGGNSPAGWIMLPIIVIAGHAVNLAINLLGAFVHDSRLQYIEFFGKFFTDGGVPFKPVEPELKYTAITK